MYFMRLVIQALGSWRSSAFGLVLYNTLKAYINGPIKTHTVMICGLNKHTCLSLFLLRILDAVKLHQSSVHMPLFDLTPKKYNIHKKAQFWKVEKLFKDRKAFHIIFKPYVLIKLVYKRKEHFKIRDVPQHVKQ